MITGAISHDGACSRHSGAKTILAHFHYCIKGQYPCQEAFDWISAASHRMAALDKEQVQFMQHCGHLVRNRDKPATLY
jgi:hypothetical protein